LPMTEEQIKLDPLVGTKHDSDIIEPMFLKGVFSPSKVLGCEPDSYAQVFESLSHVLPVQMHMEPYPIDTEKYPESPPLYKRTIDLMKSLKDTSPYFNNHERARIKFRLSAKGKFVHRNRFKRVNIICCLKGELHWLFIDSNGGEADQYLKSTTNKNWSGSRSENFPKTLSLEEMKKIQSELPKGVKSSITKVVGGDAMIFDGRWWHATSYEGTVMNMFITPGKDMEIAVKEHDKRFKLKMQKGLKVGTINLAKCSKLGVSRPPQGRPFNG